MHRKKYPVLILLFLWSFLFEAKLCEAHTISPAIVTLKFMPPASVRLNIEFNAEALIAGIDLTLGDTNDAPQVAEYKRLRRLPASQLIKKFNAFADEYSQGLSLNISGQPVRWVFDSISTEDVGDIRRARKSVAVYHAQIPSGAANAVWLYAEKYGDAVVAFTQPGQTEKKVYWLARGQPSPAYPLAQVVTQRAWAAVVRDYLRLGFIHILPRGLDHILFVLGLFLLSRKLRLLLWQVTAFTLAHSITLALSVYGVISLSPVVVEPLIALSIAFVGIENVILATAAGSRKSTPAPGAPGKSERMLITNKVTTRFSDSPCTPMANASFSRPTVAARIMTPTLKPWRVLVVFLFGLLHGLGFAGVLTQLGLPRSEFVTALVSFNIGVELGQLAVITLAFAAVFWLRRCDPLYRRVVVIPGSLMIAVMGLYWFWERAGLSGLIA